MIGRESILGYEKTSGSFVEELRYAICRYCEQVMQPMCGASLFWYACRHCHATSPKCTSRSEALQQVEKSR